MTRSSQTIRLAAALFLLFLVQACAQSKAEASTAAPAEVAASTPVAQESPSPIPTLTATAPTHTPIPIQSSATPISDVTITAVKGNLFIRRGPNMAYNPIGVLYKDTSAKIIARDVLSDWAQIQIPNSDLTGWVSVQTDYSQVEGDLKSLPEVIVDEWPLPAYVRNCTHHQMYVPEIDVVIPSSLEYPENEVWIYPGTYTALDIDVNDYPEVETFTIKEGSEVELLWDGLGEKRKCP